MTKDEDVLWLTRKEERGKRNRLKLFFLKGLLAMIDAAMPETECKTIGNMNPEGLHCFQCTFCDIRKLIKRAITFWESHDRYKSALS